MSAIVTHASGSREAQRLIKSGARPLAEVNGELVFQVDDSPGASPSERVVQAAARGAATGGVPEFVMLRHRERRLNRLGLRMGAVGLASILLIFVAAEFVPRGPAELHPVADLLWIVAQTAAALPTAAAATCIVLAWRLHGKAVVLEDVEAAHQSRAEVNRAIEAEGRRRLGLPARD